MNSGLCLGFGFRKHCTEESCQDKCKVGRLSMSVFVSEVAKVLYPYASPGAGLAVSSGAPQAYCIIDSSTWPQ